MTTALRFLSVALCALLVPVGMIAPSDALAGHGDRAALDSRRADASTLAYPSDAYPSDRSGWRTCRPRQQSPLGEWLSSSGRLFAVVADVDGSLDVVQREAGRRSVHAGSWTDGRSGFRYGNMQASYDADRDVVTVGGQVWRRLGGGTYVSHWNSSSGNRFALVEGPVRTFDIIRTGQSGASVAYPAVWSDSSHTEFRYVASGSHIDGIVLADGRIRVTSNGRPYYWTR